MSTCKNKHIADFYPLVHNSLRIVHPGAIVLLQGGLLFAFACSLCRGLRDWGPGRLGQAGRFVPGRCGLAGPETDCSRIGIKKKVRCRPAFALILDNLATDRGRDPPLHLQNTKGPSGPGRMRLRPSDQTRAGIGGNAYESVLRGLRGGVLVVALLSAAINVLMLTGSVYMMQVYDRVLSSGSVPTLVSLFAIVVVLYGFLALYDFLRGRLLGRMAIRLDRGLGTATFRAWIQGGTGTADHEAQPLRDLETLRGAIASPGAQALFDLPWLPLFLGVLFVLHPWLGWLTVGGALTGLALTLANGAILGKSLSRSGALEATARSFADGSRRDSQTLVAMGMEPAVNRHWRRLQDAALAAGQIGKDPSEGLAAASRAFRMLLQSAILSLGAYLVLQGEISAGSIIAATVLAGRALAPVDQITGQWRLIGRALHAHRRLAAFFADPAARDPQASVDLPLPKGELIVSQVTKFAPGRPGTDRPRLLTQMSFRLNPGDGLGVIGNSAAGKSTLARVLVGAWTPDAGEVRLGGALLSQWSAERLGRVVGYLPQQVDLLPGTVRDNIARFDAGASDADVIAAAQMAGVHDMILALPEGYATRVGDHWTPLSGGQKQRIGLARAVYGTPALVVLDEPNSNLDAAGDAALARAILALRQAGSIVVVMAHRPSAIAAVNKVLILHGGMAAEFGDKETVLSAAIARDTAPPPAPAVVPAPPPAEGQPARSGANIWFASQKRPRPARAARADLREA